MLPALAEAADAVTYHDARVPLVLGLTGQLAEPGQISGDYWVRQARQPVRFADTVQALHEWGADIFLEAGPDGALCALGPACLEPAGDDAGQNSGAVFVPVLRVGWSDTQALLQAVAAAFVHGVAVNWAGLTPGPAAGGWRCQRMPSSISGIGWRRLSLPRGSPLVTGAAPGSSGSGLPSTVGTRRSWRPCWAW